MQKHWQKIRKVPAASGGSYDQLFFCIFIFIFILEFFGKMSEQNRGN